MSKTKTVATGGKGAPVESTSAAPAPEFATPDEHHGRGGTYLRDPVTGERVLVQRTAPCANCQAR
ncbi:hypothetical protein JL37_11140 [Achromobacter sp. RTa]|uniref:hypothetical protein n=1 Tax=Achromobacter sp. RTa TaxID=1532557 RepID=UPI00051032AD|nr:hypothetical protein [Achromobacter sp. RTa]KGD95241.1 hypothetical protein JL37_11140 [Achromobacter sp. RTa]